LPPDLKIKAWKKFSEAFSEDNPYSQEDDSMRQKAEERMAYWQEEQEKLEQKEAEQKKIAMGKRPEKEVKGKTYKDPITGMEFIFVKGGCYEMGDTFGDGDDNERPVHEVCIDDFYIGKYEVTVGEFREFVNDTGYRTEAEKGGECFGFIGREYESELKELRGPLRGDSGINWRGPGFSQDSRHPVVCVSWNDANEFARWLSKKEGRKYRLPTEAEWEYAARSGGKKEKWAGTSNKNKLGEYAWYDKNLGLKITHPVGQKKPNGLGIYDMSGNASEHVADWYDDGYYRNSPRDNPKGPSSGNNRVFRGGFLSLDHVFIRASFRDRGAPSGKAAYNWGFRLAISTK
jgi:formylglycine-generating enzyme required for sulfatase activity